MRKLPAVGSDVFCFVGQRGGLNSMFGQNDSLLFSGYLYNLYNFKNRVHFSPKVFVNRFSKFCHVHGCRNLDAAEPQLAWKIYSFAMGISWFNEFLLGTSWGYD